MNIDQQLYKQVDIFIADMAFLDDGKAVEKRVKEFKSSLQKLINEARIEERNRYTQKRTRYSKTFVAEYLGISRPYLNTLLDDPTKFTIGMIDKLLILSEAELSNGGNNE